MDLYNDLPKPQNGPDVNLQVSHRSSNAPKPPPSVPASKSLSPTSLPGPSSSSRSSLSSLSSAGALAPPSLLRSRRPTTSTTFTSSTSSSSSSSNVIKGTSAQPGGASGEPQQVFGHLEPWDDYRAPYDPLEPTDYVSIVSARARTTEKGLAESARALASAPVPRGNATSGVSSIGGGGDAKLKQAGVGGGWTGGQSNSEFGGAMSSAAMKMMSMMGWKAGQGLGKTQQGIKVPISVTGTKGKTGLGAGGELKRSAGSEAPSLIEGAGPMAAALSGGHHAPIHAAPPAERSRRIKRAKNDVADSEKAHAALFASFAEESPVVLLRNLVSGPDEADQELEDDVRVEASKYGRVKKVLVITLGPTSEVERDSDRVRVFVQFDTRHSAAVAVKGLHGREFGGRKVNATRFDFTLFARAALGPSKGEPPIERD